MPDAPTEDVLISRQGSLGRITLNRPPALNALTAPMVEAVASALAAWAADASVGCVMLDGAGERGLCAGADIRALRGLIAAGTPEPAVDFMADEYRLNAAIAAYPKPYVAFMDGVVMGGGIGLAAHGSVRLVTERSLLAMPETSIGLFPDVGGSFLLARAPGELGTHLALTSRRIGSADAILVGLADICVMSACRPLLAAGLATCAPQHVPRLVDALRSPPPPGVLSGQRDWIDRCYAHDTVEAILAALRAEPDVAAREAAEEIERRSPVSLKITLRALREARAAPDLPACLEREFRMVQAALGSHDFSEGVRAALIDRDRPRWSPDRLDLVGEPEVAACFAPRARTLGLRSLDATPTP